MEWLKTSFGELSQQVETHIEKSVPFQGRCVIDIVEDLSLVIVVIADGVGNSVLLHFGATTSTQAVANFLKRID